MGTPVRNSNKSSISKHAARFVAEAAMSPPFVIEWRQTRSPDVGISPTNVDGRRIQRKSRASISSKTRLETETPHHSSLDFQSKHLDTPDDPDDQIPVKKLKPFRPDTLKELKSIVAASLKGQEKPSFSTTGFSTTDKPAPSSPNFNINPTTNNESLNDDSYNQLLSQIVDNVCSEPPEQDVSDRLRSPEQTVLQMPTKIFANNDYQNNLSSSTPLRRSTRLKNNCSSVVDVATSSIIKPPPQQKEETCEESVSHKNVIKKPQVIIEDDEDDDYLVAALEQVEEQSNIYHDTESLPPSKVNEKMVANNQLSHKQGNKRDFKFVNLASRQTSGKTDIKYPLRENNLSATTSSLLSNPASLATHNPSKQSLTVSEKAQIEAKRMEALLRLQQRKQHAPSLRLGSGHKSAMSSGQFNGFRPNIGLKR